MDLTRSLVITIGSSFRMGDVDGADPTPKTMAQIMAIWVPLAARFDEEFVKAKIDILYHIQWKFECVFFFKKNRRYHVGREPEFTIKARVDVCMSEPMPPSTACLFGNMEDKNPYIATLIAGATFFHIPTPSWPKNRRPTKESNGLRRLTLEDVVGIYAKNLIKDVKSKLNIFE